MRPIRINRPGAPLMNLHHEDLNLLVVFESLMETRSVSRASERMGLSQSSLSHALAKMRRSFDDPMFLRIKNEMVPTPRALSIAPAVKDVLALARGEIFQHRSFAPERSSRTFTLCMTDVAQMTYLPSIVSELRRRAPEVRIKTVSPIFEKLEEGLESGLVDLAIGYFPDMRRAGVFQQRLLRTKGFACVACAANPHIGSHGLSLAAFSSAPQVAVRTEGRSQELVEQAMEELGVTRNVVLTVPHFLALIGLIPRTDLLAILPMEVADGIRAIGGIMIHPLPFPSPRIDLVQVWHERNQRDAAHQWLRQTVFGLLAACDEGHAGGLDHLAEGEGDEAVPAAASQQSVNASI